MKFLLILALLLMLAPAAQAQAELLCDADNTGNSDFVIRFHEEHAFVCSRYETTSVYIIGTVSGKYHTYESETVDSPAKWNFIRGHGELNILMTLKTEDWRHNQVTLIAGYVNPDDREFMVQHTCFWHAANNLQWACFAHRHIFDTLVELLEEAESTALSERTEQTETSASEPQMSENNAYVGLTCKQIRDQFNDRNFPVGKYGYSGRDGDGDGIACEG